MHEAQSSCSKRQLGAMIGTALMAAVVAGNPCASGQPTDTTVLAIASAPDLYVGRCVTVTAWSNGASLFASKRALRQSFGIRDWRRMEEWVGHQMIGVYGLPEGSDDLRAEQNSHGLRWRITGRVDRCEHLHERSQQAAEQREQEYPEGVVIPLVPGHCHHWDGPVILVQEAEQRN